MKKISEFTGDAGYEVLCTLAENIVEIRHDSKVETAIKNKDSKLGLYMLKNHKNEWVNILACLNEVEPEKFEFNALTIISDINKLLADDEFIQVFKSVG